MSQFSKLIIIQCFFSPVLNKYYLLLVLYTHLTSRTRRTIELYIIHTKTLIILQREGLYSLYDFTRCVFIKNSSVSVIFTMKRHPYSGRINFEVESKHITTDLVNTNIEFSLHFVQDHYSYFKQRWINLFSIIFIFQFAEKNKSCNQSKKFVNFLMNF